MKCLRKYRAGMSKAKKAKYYILTGLIRKGYKLAAARILLQKYAHLLDYATNHPEAFFHCDADYWADFIIETEANPVLHSA